MSLNTGHDGSTTPDAIVPEAARDLGFVAVGVAAAGPARHHAAFMAWLRAGRHAGMRWLERHAPLRADPAQWIAGTRSIIVVAMRYPVNPDPAASAYTALAWGRDYHAVLRAALRRLGRRLRDRTGAAILRVCVDSAPLAEREWAVRAGLGWIGRQGQLVHPRWGCCLVLGAILTDLDLTPGTVEPNRCGDCRRCLAACPTGALLGDGTLDARRCLAYLTVEAAGPAPAQFPAAAAAGTLFGCDRCTAVCPWNGGASEQDVPEPLRGDPATLPAPDAWPSMTESGFRTRFAGTVLQRCGLDRMRRNARWAAV